MIVLNKINHITTFLNIWSAISNLIRLTTTIYIFILSLLYLTSEWIEYGDVSSEISYPELHASLACGKLHNRLAVNKQEKKQSIQIMYCNHQKKWYDQYLNRPFNDWPFPSFNIFDGDVGINPIRLEIKMIFVREVIGFSCKITRPVPSVPKMGALDELQGCRFIYLVQWHPNAAVLFP